MVIRLSWHPQSLEELIEAKVDFLSLNYTLNVPFVSPLLYKYRLSQNAHIVSRDENNLPRDFDCIILFKPNNPAR